MAHVVNPPPQVRIPDKLFSDPELRYFFEQQQLILFQLWNRTGGATDIIGNLDQIPVINVVNEDVVLVDTQLGSLVTVDTSLVDVNITLPPISVDDIGKSMIVVILDATNDCFVFQGGSDSVLGEDSVLMDDQYLSVHFTSVSLTDWIAT